MPPSVFPRLLPNLPPSRRPGFPGGSHPHSPPPRRCVRRRATRFTSEEDEQTETGMALGMEYEYRFREALGVGLLAEGILTAHPRDAILVVPFNWHPREWLKLSAAPGVEFVTEDLSSS